MGLNLSRERRRQQQEQRLQEQRLQEQRLQEQRLQEQRLQEQQHMREHLQVRRCLLENLERLQEKNYKLRELRHLQRLQEQLQDQEKLELQQVTNYLQKMRLLREPKDLQQPEPEEQEVQGEEQEAQEQEQEVQVEDFLEEMRLLQQRIQETLSETQQPQHKLERLGEDLADLQLLLERGMLRKQAHLQELEYLLKQVQELQQIQEQLQEELFEQLKQEQDEHIKCLKEEVHTLQLMLDHQRQKLERPQEEVQTLKSLQELIQRLIQLEEKHQQQQNTEATEKCYDPDHSTLTFAEGEDDHDFLCVSYRSKRARMSCGHTVTPTSLTEWCQIQLNDDKTTFECGNCKAEWPFEEVCKMALLTEDEKSTFEKKLFRNVAFKMQKAKLCPGCKSHVIRTESDNLRVVCPLCTADQGRLYEFCWQCLREWKGRGIRSDCCDNDGCKNEALETLRTCPVIKFTEVKGVRDCPSVRACPTCGKLLEHNSEGCKNIKCPDCKRQFCFVCLQSTAECLSTSDYYTPCVVAPRQTSIPIKKL